VRLMGGRFICLSGKQKVGGIDTGLDTDLGDVGGLVTNRQDKKDETTTAPTYSRQRERFRSRVCYGGSKNKRMLRSNAYQVRRAGGSETWWV